MMSEKKRNDQADWQKNSGRPSNFHEKDENLKRDSDGNLRMQKDKDGLSRKENEAIEETLNSLSENDEEDSK